MRSTPHLAMFQDILLRNEAHFVSSAGERRVLPVGATHAAARAGTKQKRRRGRSNYRGFPDVHPRGTFQIKHEDRKHQRLTPLADNSVRLETRLPNDEHQLRIRHADLYRNPSLLGGG